MPWVLDSNPDTGYPTSIRQLLLGKLWTMNIQLIYQLCILVIITNNILVIINQILPLLFFHFFSHFIPFTFFYFLQEIMDKINEYTINISALYFGYYH